MREGTPSETGLYVALEKHLEATQEPQTRVDLYDRPDVRAAAESVNVVSDALGHLWRRGFIARTPAPKSPHHQAKWAYSWPVEKEPRRTPPPHFSPVAQAAPPKRALLDHPLVRAEDDGSKIIVVTPHVTITIEHQ